MELPDSIWLGPTHSNDQHHLGHVFAHFPPCLNTPGTQKSIKVFITFCLLIFFVAEVNAQFITTWKTTDTQITIPTTGVGYNYDIVWTNLTNTGVGDGSITGRTGNYTIPGLENGSIYQVEITGSFPQIYFNNTGDKDKILTIAQWGNNPWLSMANAFYGCGNLTIPATDKPNLSNVTDMSRMFRNTSFNDPINTWDVSNVTDMSLLFNNTASFNQPLNNWVVTSVTNMSQMFRSASAFDQNIGNWDVSNVSDFTNFLSASGMSTTNYDQLLMGWNSLSLQVGVTFGANGLTFCSGAAERSNIASTFGWTFTGDASNCPITVTNTNNAGPGSLRQVIIDANAFAGANTVLFDIPISDPNYNSGNETWTIQPVTPLPNITEELIIDAGTQPGSTNRRIIVDGQNSISLFSLNLGGDDVDIRDMQIINAFSASPGAALSMTATGYPLVRIFNCSFVNNHSTADGGGLALHTQIYLVMDGCDFSGNISDGGGGAIVGYADGVINSTRCNFINNQALGGNGGAIYNALTHSYSIESSSFVGNSCSGNGGAITINDSSHSLENTTFSGNTAGLNGGAIYSDGASNGISGDYLTIYQNTAAAGGGIYMEEGGISLSNSILSMNTGGDYGRNNGGLGSGNGNFISLDPDGIFIYPKDQVGNPDPKLGALLFDGTTYFHSPLIGSPLIDAAVNIGFITEDQRGLARPQGPSEDIGAIEFFPPTTSVTSIYPKIGSAGEKILITGQNFGGVIQVDFNGTNATAFTIINSENIIATVPAGVTAGPITVTEGGSPYSSVESFIPALISDGKAANWQEISDGVAGFTEPLVDADLFGSDVAGVGDINGDGIADLIVTAPGDDTGGDSRGAIYVLFMKADRTIGSYQKISDSQGNFSGTLADFDHFGNSVCGIGDFNGDGVQDIAVSSLADDGGLDRGRVYLLYLTSSGTVDSYSIISDTQGNFTGGLSNQDEFGSSIALLGDMDGDGVSDIAVSANRDAGGGSRRGAVYVLFLNASGTVKSHQKIGNGIGGFPAILNNDDFFGRSVANLGDINGDGIVDLAVTAVGDDTGGSFAGATYILFMNSNGTVASYTKIAEGMSGFSIDLEPGDNFGNGVSQMGDLDLDGVPDMLVGADGDDDGGSSRGAAYILLLNTDGTVKYIHKISNDPQNSFQGVLKDFGKFGFSASPVGDLNGDGYRDVAIGAYTGPPGDYTGSVWILNIGIAEIELYNGPTNLTPTIVDNQATVIDVGVTSAGTGLDKIFSIENQGNAKLNLNSISVTGTDFSMVAPIPTEVLPGALVNFSVRLSGASVGTFNATVTVGNDDMTESSYDFPITGTVSSICVSQPTTNAGADVSICPGNVVSLSGTIGGGASGATWTTNGTGSFDDNTLLAATYTPDLADEANGTVTLTLTVAAAGACPQVSDELILTIAQPITAADVSVSASVQQVLNVDVITPSVINTGDVVTITITQNSTKGSTTIQSNNTIDYTASTGTVGADSFQYQICNQCNLCSTGTATIDILNVAPQITPPPSQITSVAGQSVTIPFSTFFTDLNGNIDFNSIKIIAGPTSNAVALFDTNFDLTIDYSNTPFAGTDELTIEVCDVLGACSQITLQIEVDGEITIYNGISPNGDGRNDYFVIQNIQFLEPTNKVTIYNRWGDKVFEMDDYNSLDAQKRFEGKQNNGKTLPSGVYFYKVEFPGGRETLTGYLTLKK